MCGLRMHTHAYWRCIYECVSDYVNAYMYAININGIYHWRQ